MRRGLKERKPQRVPGRQAMSQKEGYEALHTKFFAVKGIQKHHPSPWSRVLAIRLAGSELRDHPSGVYLSKQLALLSQFQHHTSLHPTLHTPHAYPPTLDFISVLHQLSIYTHALGWGKDNTICCASRQWIKHY
jgi:hypothetical protein